MYLNFIAPTVTTLKVVLNFNFFKLSKEKKQAVLRQYYVWLKIFVIFVL